MRNDLKPVRPRLIRPTGDILDVLVEDARRSASEIGRLVGLSPPRQSGASTGSSEPVSSAATPRCSTTGCWRRTIEAFIELRFAPGTQVADIDTAVIDLPEVVESFTLAGDPDALVRVRVRDLEHLKSVVDRIRRGRRGGPKVLTTRTIIVLGQTRARAEV